MPGSTDGALDETDRQVHLAPGERGLRQLIESLPDAVMLARYDGRIVFANPATETLLGWPVPDLIGMPLEDLVAPASRPGHLARRKALAADPPVGPIGVLYGVTGLTRDGREVPVEVTMTGVETAEGPLLCTRIRDASAELDRARRDAALRRIAAAAGADLPVEGLLAMVVEAAASLLAADKSLMARFDPGGDVVVVGSHGDHLTSVGDRIPTTSGSSLVTVARTGAPATLDYEDLPAGDPIRDLALSQGHRHAIAVPIVVHTRLWGGLMVAARAGVPAEALDALTRFAEYAGAVIGASESRAVERALRESEERFRLLADFIPQLLWSADADGRCDFLNRRWAEYTGIATEEQLGVRWLERVHPDDRPALMDAWNSAVNGHGAFSAEFRIRRYDGLFRRFDARGVAMRDETGRVVRWFGSNTDVEEARAAAAADRASEAQLRAALDAGRMGAWTLDVSRGILRIDANVRALFEIGDDVSDLDVRETLRGRILDEDRGDVRTAFGRALSGEAPDYHAEYRILRDDGETRWVQSRGRVTRDGDGTPHTVTGVLLDVTDERRAGERQLRSQKLEALGTLAGGIAHDFNNLLQVVGGSIAMARTELPGDHPAQESLGTVERATQRAAELVDRILAFSRPDDTDRRPVALAPVVQEALDLLRPTLPAMIEISVSVGEDLPLVHADAAGITQVVTNLATNASQAIGRRAGVIEFIIESVELESEDVTSAPGLEAGRHVVLTVSDDGPGMDAATLSRVFDPFFTTKGPGEGTGLGLSIVHSVMRSHGGAVAAYSVPGTGTAFRLYFPATSALPAAAAARETPPGAGPSRTARVLFVDDEPDLVALNERSLGRVGHTVTGFTDPQAALARFREHPDAFDVVVTDLSMPGMTGLELAREVLALRPGIPVLIATGYIPPEERAEAEAIGVRAILPKPSPIARLREVLAEVLAD